MAEIKNQDTNDLDGKLTFKAKVGGRIGRHLKSLEREYLLFSANVSMVDKNTMAIHLITGDPLNSGGKGVDDDTNGYSGNDGFLVKIGSKAGKSFVTMDNQLLLAGADISVIDDTTINVALHVADLAGIELIESEENDAEEVHLYE